LAGPITGFASNPMAPKKKETAAAPQRGLGAWLQKGVVMSDSIKIDPVEKKSPTRASTRKVGSKAKAGEAGDGAEAKSPKQVKKKKKDGPTREHERLYWDAGKTLVCGVDEAGRDEHNVHVLAAS